MEWCHRYHSLFRMNWSSRCAACKTADEQHEKRHREIAELLAKIRQLKAAEEMGSLASPVSPRSPRTPRTPLTAHALNSIANMGSPFLEPSPKTTKKERKAAKKAVKAMAREKVITSADIRRFRRHNTLVTRPTARATKLLIVSQPVDSSAQIYLSWLSLIASCP